MLASPGYLYALSWTLTAMLFSAMNPPRMAPARRAACWALLAAADVTFCLFTDRDNVLLYFPVLLAAVGFAYAIISLTCRVSRPAAVHLTVCAFLVGEFICSASWLICCFLARFTPVYLILIHTFMLGATLAAIWLFERQYAGRRARDITPRETISTVLTGAGVFLLSNISNISGNTPLSGQTPLHSTQLRMLVDLSGLMLLAAHRVAREELRRRDEADMLARMMDMQQANFRVSEQSIELIHQKYHDLKHQIALLRAETDSAERLGQLDRMESDIRGFEALCHTGNRTMDIIVTAKALQCQHMDIGFTCMAEGSLLDFMSPTDLSALLGNLLDNAIEHVSGIHDPDRRWVQVNLRKNGGFILLETCNPCRAAPEFADGLPVTTKDNADYHGYGTRSIRRIAGDYGGSAVFAVRGGWFEARVLFNAGTK